MSYTVRYSKQPYTVDQKRRLQDLYLNNGGKNSEAWYQWLFNSSFSKISVRTYFLLYKTEIVGFGSLVLKPFGGLIIGSLVNFLVDKKHRTLGPAIMLQKGIIKDIESQKICDICCTLPNKKAFMIFKRAGYEPANAAIRYVLVINPLNYFKRLRFLQYYSDIFFSLIQRLGFAIKNITIDVKFPGCNLSNFHILDKQDKSSLKISDYLNWRYFESYKYEYKIFSFKYNNGKPVDAFIVFHIEGNILMIDDIAHLEPSIYEKAITRFIYQVLKQYSLSSISINSVSHKEFYRTLSDIGFFKRFEINRSVLMRVFNQNISNQTISSFSFTMQESYLDI